MSWSNNVAPGQTLVYRDAPMHHGSDQFAKNLLRDTLSLASLPETEVEVLAATQKIDVYASPDPARAGERKKLGLLGELSEEPSMFEAFSNTPSIDRIRRCMTKQLSWHHELDRRARTAANASAPNDDDDDATPVVVFPWLVVLSSGRPKTVLDAYGCKKVRPGLYEAVKGLRMRIVVIAELPRTRDTVLLRLLGKGRALADAMADVALLPLEAWERSIAMPLLVRFKRDVSGAAKNSEEDMSAEIQAWFQEYERKLRDEGHKEGERDVLLRLLGSRFGELPASVVGRVRRADANDIERWVDRFIRAQTIADVFEEAS